MSNEILELLKENSGNTNFTTKVRKLGFHVDNTYYTVLCSIQQSNTVSHNIPVYKDGNRLGKKKTYAVLKRKEEIIQNRLKSIQDGTAEYLSDKDFEDIINKRKGN